MGICSIRNCREIFMINEDLQKGKLCVDMFNEELQRNICGLDMLNEDLHRNICGYVLQRNLWKYEDLHRNICSMWRPGEKEHDLRLHSLFANY